jgi:hypothetical protein
MAPVYVPGLSPAGNAETASDDGAVPDAAVKLNQVRLVVAFQESVPVPLFEIWMDCAAGAVPPVV